jgi:hypothetical protein
MNVSATPIDIIELQSSCIEVDFAINGHSIDSDVALTQSGDVLSDDF